MIDVKNINGEVRLSVPVSDSCIHSKGVMQEDYVLLSFCSDVLIDFQKGDYIEFDNERFSIVYVEKAQRTDDGGYSYEQKFHAPWEILRSRVLFFDRQYLGEATWKMTHKPENFMSIVISNIKSAGLGDYTFEVDASLTDMKLVQFDSTNIIDALSLIAEAWKTEWWFTGNVIHLSKCEFGTPLKLSLYDELASVESDKSSDTAFATRLYVFGSTRNLPKDYRKDEVGTVINGIVEKRLLLPKGIPYIDAWENMAAKDVVEGVMVIDDVYPKRVGKLSTVTSKEYTETVEDQDGKEIKQTWNAYRYTDVELTFSNKYIIPDEELKIIFQKGKLTGMEFAVKFNPDGLPESETGAQVFEIVRNEDYGIPLPSTDFAPAVDDEYILYGYDTKFVADTLVPMAEDELLRRGKEELEKLSRDKSVCTAQTNKVRCAGYKLIEGGKLSYNELDEINLEIGQSVLLDTNHLFSESGRISRIYSYEKKLNNLFDASYSIGESSRYSKSGELKAQLDELSYQNKQYVGVGGSSVYLIKKYDTTPPSDFNAYSALRAKDEFLSKKHADTAHGTIGFEQGAEFGTFIPGLIGSGGHIDGNGRGELRSLRLWETLEVPELRYNRVSVYIGIRMDTFGGGIIESVSPDPMHDGLGTATLKLEDGEYGAVEDGDLMMGIWHDMDGNSADTADDHLGNFSFAGFKTVYFQITGVSGSRNEQITYMLRSRSSGGNGIHPFSSMHFAARGNIYEAKKDRHAFVYSTTQYSVSLTGVMSWDFRPEHYYEIHGNLEGFKMPAIDRDGNHYMKVFHKHGVVFGNAYIFGEIDKFKRQGYRCSVNQSMNGMLMPNEEEKVYVTVFDGYGSDVTEQFTKVSVTRNTGDAVSDAYWNAQPERQNSTNPFTIAYKDLGIDGIRQTVAVFEIVMSDEVNGKIAKGDLDYF